MICRFANGNRTVFSVILAFTFAVITGSPACGLEYPNLELSKLPEMSEAIVLAKVMDSKKLSDAADEITIKVECALKGDIKPKTELKIVMASRGVEGFDPFVKPADTGVFFLKQISSSGAKLAYSGSVAIFGKSAYFMDPREAKTSRQKTEKPKEATKEVPSVEPKKVRLETSLGNITIELDEKAAPVTVKNFLIYVEEGFYDGTIFHRVIPGFMIQGGGFTADMNQKPIKQPIKNEAGNGLKNDRGTIAMARTSDPNSATSQFFINVNNNGPLNRATCQDGFGYAVFGMVTEGVDVVDKIVAVKTTTKYPHENVPVEPVVIKKASVVKDAQPAKK